VHGSHELRGGTAIPANVVEMFMKIATAVI
jgi:hypothetical protein